MRPFDEGAETGLVCISRPHPCRRLDHRFYAVSSLAAARKSSPNSSNRDSASGEAESGKTAEPTIPNGTGEQTRPHSVVADLESASTLPQSPNIPGNPEAPADTDSAGGAASTSCSVRAPEKSNITADATTVETPASTEIVNTTPTPITQPSTTRTASRCPSSITWSFSQERVSTSPERKADGGLSDGDGSRGGGGGAGGGGGGGGSEGTSGFQIEQTQQVPSAQSSQPASTARVATMNSMADALSHQCLLYFAADFGISGALLSTLEVGEIFLSCDGESTVFPICRFRY